VMIRTVIKIEDFDYFLPDEKIAKYPLRKRDDSKMLVYKKGKIGETVFRNLPDYFAKGDLLVFNNTRVIQARLIFKKSTGSLIEILCLEPVDPTNYQISLQKQHTVIWQCLVGNAKRWKSGLLEKSFYQQSRKIKLFAEMLEKKDAICKIRFSWQPDNLTFASILDLAGLVPIPPYLKREPVADDKIIMADSDGQSSG